MNATNTTFVKFVNDDAFSNTAIDGLVKLAVDKVDTPEAVAECMLPYYKELMDTFYTIEEAMFVDKFCSFGAMVINKEDKPSIVIITSGKNLNEDHKDYGKLVEQANTLFVENGEQPFNIQNTGFHWVSEDAGMIIGIIDKPEDSGICLVI